MRALFVTALLVAAPPVAQGEEPPLPPPPAPMWMYAPPPVPATVIVRPEGPPWPASRLGTWLLTAQLTGGIELPQRPHDVDAAGHVVCNAASDTCTVTAFSVGGELLWRGLVGFGIGLYASEGSPLVPDGAMTTAGVGDRISVNASLALRPLAWRAWHRSDDFVARLLGGVGLEIGPSVEYTRTSSATLPGCSVPAVATRPGFHGLLSAEVPLLGDARSGRVALRLAARLLDGPNVGLAPTQGSTDPTCHAQVIEAGLSVQLLAGFAFYL